MLLYREDLERYKSFSRRALFLGAGKAVLLSALVGRMYYLQVIEADRFRTLAEDNRINLRLLPPPRGRIFDRFGVPLAVNEPNFRILMVREQVEQVAELDEVLAGIDTIVPLEEYDQRRIERELDRHRDFVPVTVAENLTWDQVSQLESNAPDLPGVSIEVGQTRFYPLGSAFTHILGYVAAVNEDDLSGDTSGDPLLELPGFRIGRQGIEKVHDLDLRGSAGSSQVEVNAVGRIIRELERDDGVPGRDLILAQDAGLQSFVHQRLMSEESAAAVVLDIENGDVLALASHPSYDPMNFILGLTTAQWQGLVNDPLVPLTNKAIAGLYAPGSTFKMMVAIAAQESGIDASHTTYCPGHMDLGNGRFHCWKRGGHGTLAMVQALERSCDVYFYDLARRVGIDKIAEVAQRFGLGATVGIDLPGEKAGIMPTRDWKEANVGEAWQGGETLVAAIGQGFTLATPLQLAVMVARLASGRAVVPRITYGLQGPDNHLEHAPVAFPEVTSSLDHLAVVRQGMTDVVNSPTGTAYRSRITEEGFAMAGKTGTSQVRRISRRERETTGVIANEDLPWEQRDHALFVAFAPLERPRYACAVVVEHGGGGSRTAAPIVHDILLETQRRAPAGRSAFDVAAVPVPDGQEG